jgi:hypothetical protein
MSGSWNSWVKWRTAIGVVVIMAAGLLVATPPASAAPAAPSGLSPSGGSVSANPILSWGRVKAATSYDVEVSDSSTFASTLYTVTTTNNRATPTAQLPMSKIWWRVRTRTSAGTSTWATASFNRSKVSGPTLLSPADGKLLKQPEDPPLLRWEAISGATSYTVEVDRGETADWVDSVTYTTQTTSLVLPDPQENGLYWWRVRAELGAGQSTHSSAARSYQVGPLPVVTGTSPSNRASIEEVVLEWDPVPGAVTYDIRVSTDSSFNTIIDSKVVRGTRYSPAKTYDVDDYWWQVRARNIFGKAKEWHEVEEKHEFRRSWEGTGAVPELLYPADRVSPSVGDDFYYQWTPARLATRYRLDVGEDPNFSPGTFNSCFTTQTTYTPGYQHPGKPKDLCMPESMVTYYWRVKALDSWKGETNTEVQGVYSTIRKFTYSTGQVTQVSPLTQTDGTPATVDIPTLRWEPALDAVKYEVEVKWSGGSTKTTTHSTSWTATTSTGAKLDPSKGTFTWTVRAIDHNGKKSSLPVFSMGESFTITGDIPTTGAAPLTPLGPASDAAPTQRFPELTWEPVEGADHYKLAVGPADGGVTVLPAKFPYPAGTDTSDAFLTAGSYQWLVAAYDKSGNQLPGGPGRGTFVLEDPPSTRGQAVALEGWTHMSGGPTCDKALSPEPTLSEICSGMKATPVLDWEPVPGVGYYMVYLSRDRNFQNMVYGSYSDSTKIPTTTNTMWTPTEALNESQAGYPYYWHIRPCKAPGNCAPDPLLADHAFAKLSNLVEPKSPVPVDGVAPVIRTNEVTFEWTDYLETNQKSNFSNPITGEAAGQAARAYLVEVSTSRSFATLVDSAIVDQTTYTAFAKMYPEGQLYWRVQAIDGSGNGLAAWTDPIAFTKTSPTSKPLTPEGPAATTQPFRWEPAPYAESYDLEVYKNGDTAASSTNRVVSVNSKQVAYTVTKPLPGGTTYVWRVRRVDSSKNKGAWSKWTPFQVAGGAPGQVTPKSGAWVGTNNGLFTWTATPDATSYLFERRLVGATWNTESVKTVATAWAPHRSIPTGTWEWRVSSLDAAGKVIASSNWRSFKVDATGPTVVKSAPTGYSVKPGANFKVRFDEPVKNISGKTVRLHKDGAKRKLKARVTLSATGKVATLNPARRLKRGTYYTLSVTQRVTDRRGNKLQRAYSSRIRTR